MHLKNTLPPPSWQNVRSIYKKLSDEFHVLTDAYKLKVDPETKNNLDHLITVIDEVDSCIDDLTDRTLRDAVTESLINYLEGEETDWTHPYAPSHLAEKMKTIKYIVRKNNIQKEFIEAAQQIFLNTELKRHTENPQQIIEYIKKEGQATAMLPLSILKIGKEEPFGIFFTKLCMIMGIADLVFDAREDYRNGLIILKPNLALYFKLHLIVFKEGLSLLIRFPRRLRFIVYCMKFTMELTKE